MKDDKELTLEDLSNLIEFMKSVGAISIEFNDYFYQYVKDIKNVM